MILIPFCMVCKNVKKAGGWEELTVLDMMLLKTRKGEWKEKPDLCPNCAEKMGGGNEARTETPRAS